MRLTRVQIESVMPIAIAAAVVLLSGCEQSAMSECNHFDNVETYALNTMQVPLTTPQFYSDQAKGQKLRAGIWGVGANIGNTSATLVGIKNEQAVLYKPNESSGVQLAPDVAALIQEHSHRENTLWIIESNYRITNNH